MVYNREKRTENNPNIILNNSHFKKIYLFIYCLPSLNPPPPLQTHTRIQAPEDQGPFFCFLHWYVPRVCTWQRVAINKYLLKELSINRKMDKLLYIQMMDYYTAAKKWTSVTYTTMDYPQILSEKSFRIIHMV